MILQRQGATIFKSSLTHEWARRIASAYGAFICRESISGWRGLAYQADVMDGLCNGNPHQRSTASSDLLYSSRS